LDLAALTPSEELRALNSISPSRNAALTFNTENIAFQAMDIICHRLDMDHFRSRQKQLSSSQKETTLLVANETLPYGSAARKTNRSLFWLDGFGDQAHFHAANGNPSLSAIWSGAFLGIDHFGEGGMVGGSLGFTSGGIDQHNNGGHDRSSTYTAVIYSTIYIENHYIDLCALGAFNEFDTIRNIAWPGFFKKAKGDYNGWLGLPHLGWGYDWSHDRGILEPFLCFDVAVLSEEKYSETGAGSLNMTIHSRTSSILRTEAGLRFYQEWSGWIFKETLSYINKQPFDVGKMTAAIVGAPATFNVNAYEQNQSLFRPGLEILYRSTQNDAMVSFSYDGEFGSGYISNEVQLRIGTYF
jgi:outer membrane autotransporter protein